MIAVEAARGQGWLDSLYVIQLTGRACAYCRTMFPPGQGTRSIGWHSATAGARRESTELWVCDPPCGPRRSS